MRGLVEKLITLWSMANHQNDDTAKRSRSRLSLGEDDRMTISNTSLLGFAVGCAALCLVDAAKQASAQTFPNRPVTSISSVSPGGTYDIFMRALSDGFRKISKQPLIIEPRPGGNNMLAGRACALATPDGYTICSLSGEATTAPELIFKSVPYDARKDLTPIMTLLINSQVLAVNADLKVKTLEELAAYARSNREKLSYIAAGLSQRAFLERFNKTHGLDLVGVPFKGGGDAVTLLLNGAVQIGFFGGANFWPYVRDGRMVALGVAGDRPSPLYPETKTLAELSPGDKFFPETLTLNAPTKTPPEAVQILNRTFAEVIRQPSFLKTNLYDRGLLPVADTPEQAAQFIARNREVFKALVQELGLQPQ